MGRLVLHRPANTIDDDNHYDHDDGCWPGRPGSAACVRWTAPYAAAARDLTTFATVDRGRSCAHTAATDDHHDAAHGDDPPMSVADSRRRLPTPGGDVGADEPEGRRLRSLPMTAVATGVFAGAVFAFFVLRAAGRDPPGRESYDYIAALIAFAVTAAIVAGAFAVLVGPR